jgi:diacylglycerol kinase (ATP)
MKHGDLHWADTLRRERGRTQPAQTCARKLIPTADPAYAPDMRAAVIINPIAGTDRGAHLGRQRTDLAAEVLARHGVDSKVSVTESSGHAGRLAREAVEAGASLVFAWGGDGTVNEVAGALAFGPAALAIIPAGSGNGLARALGIPPQPDRAILWGLEHAERRIDLGELGDRLFVNVAGVGLDARVASRFAGLARRRRGLLPYVGFTISEYLASAPAEYLITMDGVARKQRALLVVLANSRQYGSGAVVAPEAQPDDGILDLVVVDPVSAREALWGAKRLFNGTFTAAQGVSQWPVRELTISANGPILFHVDGEPVRGGPTLTARVHPHALRVKG